MMDVARNRDGETDTVSGDEVDTTGRLEPPSDAGLGPASEGERGRDTDRTVGRFYHGDLPYTRRYYLTYGPYYGRVQRNDEDIWRDIQIGMDWDEYVNPDHVRVQVQDGVVTLEGAVASPLEKRSAGDDAWDTPGVRDVRNRLSISGEPEPVATGERWEVGEKVTVESSRREREGEALPQIQGESSARASAAASIPAVPSPTITATTTGPTALIMGAPAEMTTRSRAMCGTPWCGTPMWMRGASTWT